jgi:hypothetical protein
LLGRLDVVQQTEHVFGVLVLGKQGVDKDASDTGAFDRTRLGVARKANESRTAVAREAKIGVSWERFVARRQHSRLAVS